MTERTTDEEKLAALLDGRLEEGEREALLSRLVSSPEMLEAYAEAVAVARELEGEDEARGVVALGERRRRWFQRPGMRVLAAAAGLAVIVAIPWRLGGGDDAALDAGTFAALVRAGQPVTSIDRPASGWPVRRAAAGAGPADETALRLGGELAWLEVSLDAGDTAGVRRSAAEIEGLLDGLPAGAPLAAIYRSVAADPSRPSSEVRPLLDQAAPSVARIAGEDLVTLGAWIEMARTAASRRQTEFFADPATHLLLESASANEDLPAAGRRVFRGLADALGSGEEPEWRPLQEELDLLPDLLLTG